jgi:uncharacterized membrane protein
MFELFTVAIAVIALVTAHRSKRRVEALRERLDRLTLQMAGLQTRRSGPMDAEGPAEVAPSRPEPIAPEPTAPERTPDASEPPSMAGTEIGAAAGPGQSSGGSVPPVDAAPAPEPGPQPLSLEERLGTRWAVWLGGLALGLGGLLLVRYSIEQGWFGPGARIFMGLLFAAALIIAGEWFRRGERNLDIEVIPTAHIPGVLTAAGTATLFGTVYAAHALYGFIGSGAAFVILGAVAITTMLAAALHGPALAGFGLLGAYVAPVLVTSVRPSPWPVVVYLGIVATSAMGLARMRRWLWLAASAVGGAVLWGLILADRMGPSWDDWTFAAHVHALVQMLLAAGFLAIDPHLGTADEDARTDPVATTALGALTFLVLVLLMTSPHQLGAMLLLTLAATALLLVVAWRTAPAAWTACMAGLVILTALAVWPGLRMPPPPSLMVPELSKVLRLPENVESFVLFAASASLAIAAINGLRLWLGARLAVTIAATYALAATVTPLLALVLAWLRVKQFDASLPFACAGLVLGFALATAADRFERRESAELPATRIATGAFAAAAVAALAIAFVVSLERGYLTVALALTALGTAWIADRRDIPLLRHMVTALAVIVLARIAWDPRIAGANVGRMPILNWLLVGYGISSAAFFGAARFMERRGADFAMHVADAVAVLLAGLLAFFQIRHALNGGDPFAPTWGYIEAGLFALVSLGYALALMRLDTRRANVVFHWASLAFGGGAAAISVLALGLLENPLFTGDPVLGPTLFSSLLLAYLMPGLAALYVARESRNLRPDWYVTVLYVMAGALVFGWVTLEVRHAFQGPFIGAFRWTSAPEHWAYSAVWLLLGIIYLAYGIWRDNLMARIASALLVVLSTGKVFLIDLAHLTGLWRALSFILLGVVLIGIGLVYQNLVFGKRPGVPTPPQSGEV